VADLRYPTRKLTSSDDYLHIKVVKYQPPGIPSLPGGGGSATGSANNNQVTVQSNIYLPIPQGIEDSNSVTWGEDTLNPIAAAGVGAAKNVIGSQDFGKGVIDEIKSLIGMTGEAATGGNLQDLTNNAFAGMAVNSLGANVSVESLLARSTGQILNPNMELLFQGVKLRSFNFQFDLVARDSYEGQMIKTIIRTFKMAMAPRKGSTGLFVSAPDVFQLEYKKGSGKHPFLPTFKPCALVSMNVNYTGSGTYATYSDGTPVHMTLQLSFQEINPVYVEDYEDSAAQTGVGY